MRRPDELEPPPVEQDNARLESEARTALQQPSCTRLADVRYAGQAYELTVRVPDGPVDVDRLVRDFVDEHLRTYGHGSPLDPVEVVAVRVLGRVERVAGRRYDPLAAIERLPRTESSR